MLFGVVNIYICTDIYLGCVAKYDTCSEIILDLLEKDPLTFHFAELSTAPPPLISEWTLLCCHGLGSADQC